MDKKNELLIITMLFTNVVAAAGELRERYEDLHHWTEPQYDRLRVPAPVDGHESTQATTRVTEAWAIAAVTTMASTAGTTTTF